MMKITTALLLALLGFSGVLFGQGKYSTFPLEIPAVAAGDKVIVHTGFSLLYNETHEQSQWVAYELTKEETVKVAERTNKFITDPAVKTKSANDRDYRGSGYDRGHMAPAADMGWSVKSMQESFYFSNMSPQVPACNRGVWKRLEEQVRDWARDYGAVYIVTGPVLTEGLPAIGANRVSVPEAYYKVILDYTEPGIKGIGFIVPNAGSEAWIGTFAVTIDSVESVTGIDFFPGMSDEDEFETESILCTECWKW